MSDNLMDAILDDIRRGDYDLILDALETGELDLDEPINGIGDTLMHLAVGEQCIELMVELLALGVEPDPSNDYGVTPFYLCCKNGDVDMAELLLRTGQVDIDAQDEQGRTGLNRAVEERRLDMVKFLKEAGADPDLDDCHYGKPLDTAIEMQLHEFVAELTDYHMPPRAYIDDTLDREELLRRNEHEQCSLDANLTWYRWDTVTQVLEASDERLNKADLMQKGADGLPYMVRATKNGCLPEILKDMHAHGEQLLVQDLLQRDGSPSPLLDIIGDYRQAGELFQMDNWVGQSVASMRQVYNALSEDAREQVRNVHSLQAQLGKQERLAAQEGGVSR